MKKRVIPISYETDNVSISRKYWSNMLSFEENYKKETISFGVDITTTYQSD